MTDHIDEMLRTSTEVMTELVSKAREAVASGESRRSFFSKTAKIAGATALGAAGAGLLQPIAARAATQPAGTMNTDSVQDILDIAATAEALATTFYYNALQNPGNLPDVNSTANRNYFQAATVQEFEHLMTLQKLGGKPYTTKFYYPTNMFTDESVFFPTALLLEEFFISAYLAAALDFSGAVSSEITTADPYALGFAVQVLGVECEHRALLGVAANINPPNGKVFETALLKSVKGAVPPLTPFLSGGDGYSGPFSLPHPGEINSTASPYGFSFFPKEIIV
jgi:rubrerythrin